MAVYFRVDNVTELTTDADVNIYGAAFSNDNTTTLSSLNISGLNASSIAITDSSKNLSSGTLSANITLTTGELNTIQDIATGSSPTFVNVTASSMGIGTTDLTTKGYVDALSNGIKWKASSRAGTTGNITLENEQTIDTIACVAGDRVLVKDQDTASQNGIYTVVDLGSWTRTSDADTAEELVSATIAIEEGSVNVDGIYYCTNDSGFTLDTNDVNFVAIFTSVPSHNSLAIIQGGTSNEYYHLTSSEHTEISNWLDNVTLASNGDTTVANLTATGDITVDSSTNAVLNIDRGANTNYASLEYETAGAIKWMVGMRSNSSEDYFIYRNGGASTKIIMNMDHSLDAISFSTNSYLISGAATELKISSTADGTLKIDSANDVYAILDRGANTYLSVLEVKTAGTLKWDIGARGDSTDDLHIYRNGGGGTEAVMTFDHSANNVIVNSKITTAGILDSTLTASSMVISDSSKNLVSGTLTSNITLTAGELDTVQDIGTSSNPQFSYVTASKIISTEIEYNGDITIDSINGIGDGTVFVINSLGSVNLNVGGSITSTGIIDTLLTPDSIVISDASKNLDSATLTSNITLTSGELDTAQDIQTSSSPTFVNVTASNMGTGTTDLTTKGYVDSLVHGVTWKESARAATTGNITLANEQTIDTVDCVAGDRVFVKDQADASENGIYIVVDLGSWTRAPDVDIAEELVSATVAIEEGSDNIHNIYHCTNDSGFTLDTDDVNFVIILTSVPQHNSLTGVQGGTGDEYYHLTASEHTELSGWLDNVTLASNGDTTLTTLTTTGTITIDSATHAYAVLDRGANTNLGMFSFLTAGTLKWDVGMKNDSTEDFHIYQNGGVGSGTVMKFIHASDKIEMITAEVELISAANGTINIDATNSAYAILDRGAITNLAAVEVKTAGILKWDIGARGDSTNDFHIYRNGGGGTESVMKFIHADDRIELAAEQLKLTPSDEGGINIDAGDAAYIILDRGGSNFRSDVRHTTAGVIKWQIGMDDDATDDYHIYRNGGGGTWSVMKFDHASDNVIVNSKITTTGLLDSTLTASSIVLTDGSKNLVSGTLTSNITLMSGELDTAQSIQTSSSPTFVNVTASNMGTGNTDLATKEYVDLLVQGIKWKESARVATTGNITLANEQAIDTVDCVDGDRVLVKDQTDAFQNGIYTVVDSGSWTRSSDADTANKLVASTISIEEGTTHIHGIYHCTNDAGFTLDTDDIIFIAIFHSVPTHNSLADIQGGTSNEYYHLTSSEHTELTGWLDNVTLASNGETTLTNLTATGIHITLDSATNAYSVIDRGANTNFADLELKTAGVLKWQIGTRSNSTDDLHIYRNGGGGSETVMRFDHAADEVEIDAATITLRSTASTTLNIDGQASGIININRDHHLTDSSIINYETSSNIQWSMGMLSDNTQDFHIYRDGGAGTRSVVTFDHSASQVSILESKLLLGSIDNAEILLDRASNENNSSIINYTTSGSTKFIIGISGDGTEDLHIYRSGGGGAGDILFFDHSDDVVSLTTNTFNIGATTGNIIVDQRSTAGWCDYVLDGNSSSGSRLIYRHDNSTNLWYAGTTTAASLDYRINRIGGAGTGDIMQFVHATDSVLFPTVYAATVTSSRDLEIQSDGKIGYVSSITASKINISNIIDISWLYQLTPKKFNYRERDDDGTYTEIAETSLQYGLIAEDVSTINDNLCIYDTVKDHVPECDWINTGSCSCSTHQELGGIYYKKLITPMLQAMKEQKILIDELTARISALE